MSTLSPPSLEEIWPFRQVAVPADLSGIPIDRFLVRPQAFQRKSVRISEVALAEAEPSASYAMRLTGKGNLIEGSVWFPFRGCWIKTFEYQTNIDFDGRSVILEFGGVLLGNIASPSELRLRIHLLMQHELSSMNVIRLFSRLIGVVSIMVLFSAVRIGVEANALEPFVTIFFAAFCIGMASVYLRQKCRSTLNKMIAMLRDQFLFEYNRETHAGLKVSEVFEILHEVDVSQEERSVIFGFFLLLSFVYFISPLIVIGVLIALFLGIVTLGSGKMKKHHLQAQNRSEWRLENAVLSYRAGNDRFTPFRLRQAKKEVLRDRLKRFEKVSEEVKRKEVGEALRLDTAHAFALVAIVGAYVLPIALGLDKSVGNLASSLEAVSLFSVAPVIVLISISRSTVATAKIVNNRLNGLSKM